VAAELTLTAAMQQQGWNKHYEINACTSQVHSISLFPEMTYLSTLCFAVMCILFQLAI
jgi:hypothetical protein